MNNETNEKKLEAELLKATLNKLVDGFISIDQVGTILSVNPATEKIFGYSAEEMLGQNVKMLMPEPDHSQHDGYLKNYLKTGVAQILGTAGREVTGSRKNGTTFPVELGISEIKTDEGRVFVGILRDITEKKRDARKRSPADTNFWAIAE